MAQAGDTITFTYNGQLQPDNIRQKEDISTVNSMTVDFCDGNGPQSSSGGAGGRVEDATVDVSGQNTLYIWVAGDGVGRYTGGANGVGDRAGGSTELSFIKTDEDDSPDEPFLVAAGGGGTSFASGFISGSGGGARGGVGKGSDGDDGNGTAPPAGGDGATSGGTAEDGEGGIDDQNRGLVSGGTTIKGGGSGPGTAGEVKITFGSSKPSAPSGLSVTIQ
jgi:hypothetical protein